MNCKGLHVLIAEGRARQALPLAKAFRDMGCTVSALCTTKLDVSYASRYTSYKILGICDASRETETIEQINSLLCTGRYDVVVPTTDFSAAVLSKNKPNFSKYCKVVSNDWTVYQIAADKLKTMEVCMKNNIPCPITLSEIGSKEQLLSAGLKYPIVVKPRVGYGAIGFKRIADEDELLKWIEHTDDLSQYVFQEYIPQTDLQYECAMFMDACDNVKTALVFSKNRWFPVDGGSSTLNITVLRPDIVENCAKLLKAIHWRGAADIDLIQDPRDNTAKIMEINPRVSGSVKICFEAGTNQARQMLELAYEQPVTEYLDYKQGCRLRCSQTDLLWFIKSKNRFNTKPSWFSLASTKDQTFAIDDPLPWFAFSIQGAFKYKTEMKKRR